MKRGSALGVARKEEARVAILRLSGEVLRAPALRVEVGELARDAGQALAVVVDRPGLEGDALGRLAQAEHARLLGEVREAARADQPVAVMPLDAVLVRIA